ncbi:Histone deacetylase [Hyphomicrobium sp. GJ21]|nr:Histone deacetylase [Hyphomicrobium sp. GJ21]
MAIFHGSRRRGSLNDAVHSGDNTLNVLLMVLLVAFALASWYFYATPMAGQSGADMATISGSPTPGSGESAIHPSP